MISWQVSKLTAYHERGIYELERDAHGVWELVFSPRHREWPSMRPVCLVRNDADGNVVDFESLEDALAFAEKHAEQFVAQAKAVGG